MELMILSFKTKIAGKPTNFPHKIWCGLLDFNIVKGKDFKKFYNDYNVADLAYKPKIHTIREDKNDRWKPGIQIDFFINARQKDMFRFAPRVPVISTQKIKITYSQFLLNGKPGLLPAVWIDDKLVYDFAQELTEAMLQIAYNDGFESLTDFFSYFNDSFEGKIIHWTNFKYE